MKLATLNELRIDEKFAPGWSLNECRRRRSFLARVDEEAAWVAAVDPTDPQLCPDMRWLTNRGTVKLAVISEETLREALQLFGDVNAAVPKTA